MTLLVVRQGTGEGETERLKDKRRDRERVTRDTVETDGNETEQRRDRERVIEERWKGERKKDNEREDTERRGRELEERNGKEAERETGRERENGDFGVCGLFVLGEVSLGATTLLKMRASLGEDKILGETRERLQRRPAPTAV